MSNILSNLFHLCTLHYISLKLHRLGLPKPSNITFCSVICIKTEHIHCISQDRLCYARVTKQFQL